MIDAFENDNLDYIDLADTLGINRATARSIVATYLRDGRRDKLPRGGDRHHKMDDDMRNRLQHALELNPLMTLQQLKVDLEASLP